MGVTYDLIDAPYPYLCAVYRCRCGAAVTRHGDEAGAPPPGWQVERKQNIRILPDCPADNADGG